MRKNSVILLLVIISMLIIAVCITRDYVSSGSSLNAAVVVSCDRAHVEKPIKDAPDAIEVYEDVARCGDVGCNVLLNEVTPTQKETYIESTGLKVSDSVNSQTMSTSASCELNVLETRSMVAAHSSLRNPVVADPESEENKKILQQMMFKAFAGTSKNATR